MFEERDLGETQILAALIGVSEMVGNLSDLHEVLRTVVRIAPQLVRVDRCSIFLHDPRGKVLIPAEAYSPRPELAELFMDNRIDEEQVPRLINKVVHQKLPCVVRDLPQEDMLSQELIKAWKLKSMLIVPLVSKGRTQGIMTLDSTTSRHYFTSKEINIVTGIANQVATAIENSRLQEESLSIFRKIEGLVDDLSDAVVKVDGEMKVRGLGPNSERFLSWKEEELRGKRWTKVLKPKDVNGRLLEEMDFVGKDSLVNGEMSSGQKAFVLKGNNGKVFCHIKALPLRSQGGHPSQLLFVFKKVPIPKRRKKKQKELGLETALQKF
ncbi:MAG: GAF domain-containing protein [Thermoplasmata archaeon]